MIRAYKLNEDGIHPVDFDDSAPYLCIPYKLFLKLHSVHGDAYRRVKGDLEHLVNGKVMQLVPIHIKGKSYCACLCSKPVIPCEVKQGGAGNGFSSSV